MAVESNTYNDYSVAASETEPLISNFSFWLKPQVTRELFDVNPVETDFGDFMKMGLMKEVFGPEVIHHEANSRFDVPIVNTSTTQADVYGTASLVNGDPAAFVGLPYIQLSAGSHSPQTGPNALKKSFPRVGNNIMFSNNGEWRVQGKRTSIDGAHRLYLKKVKASVPDLSSTITLVGSTYGGNSFIVHTSSFGEASLGMQEGLVPTSKAFTSYLQKITNFYEVTDFQEKNEIYEQVWDGKVLNFTYPKGINDTEIVLGAMIDNALFLANKDDGTLTETDPETGEEKVVTTTEGYAQNLNTNAPKLFYDNAPTLALIDNTMRLRRKLQQGLEAMTWTGFEFRTAMEGIVTQLGVQGSMIYDRMAVDLNVDTIKKGNMVFHLKDLKIMNHPKFGAAPGFKYPFEAIVAPMQKEKDPKYGTMEDPFTVIYKKQVGDGARGVYKIFMSGADAARANGTRWTRRIHMGVHVGMKTVASSKHIYIKPTALT